MYRVTSQQANENTKAAFFCRLKYIGLKFHYIFMRFFFVNSNENAMHWFFLTGVEKIIYVGTSLLLVVGGLFVKWSICCIACLYISYLIC